LTKSEKKTASIFVHLCKCTLIKRIGRELRERILKKTANYGKITYLVFDRAAPKRAGSFRIVYGINDDNALPKRRAENVY